jgi:CheY-like chemotaxis protein
MDGGAHPTTARRGEHDDMGGSSDSKKQLGKILLQQKLVSPDELQEMLDDQKREPGSRLASTAARTGRLSMQDALRALAEQHDVPGVDLTEQVIALGMLRLIPIEIAHERCVFPLRLDGDQLLLAMSSPDETELIEELEFITAKKIQRCVALDGVVRRVVQYAYEALDRGEEYYVGAHVSAEQLAALGLPELPRAPEPLSAYPGPQPAAAPEAEPPPESSSAAAEPASSEEPDATELTLGTSLDQAFGQRMRPSQPPVERAIDAGARALLALPDPELRARLVFALQRSGIVTLEAEDGKRALELVRDASPSLLLVEIGRHSVQGLDVCRRLRASQRYAQRPIVALGDGQGGWRLARDLRDGFGIEHFFEPPFDVAKIGRTVRLLLEGQPILDELPPLSPEAEARWSGGMQAYERGDVDAAIAELEAGAALDPGAFELQYHLGLLYGRRDDLFAAIHALELAVSLQGKHFAAIKNLAVVYQRAGFLFKALDAWQRAATVAPDDETRANIKQHMVSLL